MVELVDATREELADAFVVAGLKAEDADKVFDLLLADVPGGPDDEDEDEDEDDGGEQPDEGEPAESEPSPPPQAEV